MRTILHSDINAFYASVECSHRPDLAHLPVAVTGDPELRHGIVLAKNALAKRCGVTTGEALWTARGKCPNIVFIKADYKKYLDYAKQIRRIYADFTDQVEPYGMDEAWLDVTGSTHLFGDGRAIADEIRSRIRCETGVTASVGVSFNKIFAKLGSDLKKPDATTVIGEDDFRAMIWPLPVGELLFVGRATSRKLCSRGITTIGRLAALDPELPEKWLGKCGAVLWQYANGLDSSPVSRVGDSEPIKSIGNSTTTPRDLETPEDVKKTLLVLAESVGARLREHGLAGRVVQISIRDSALVSFERQTTLARPTCYAQELAREGLALVREHYDFKRPIRSLGLRCGSLCPSVGALQLGLVDDAEHLRRMDCIETAMDRLRDRYGHFSIQRAILIGDGLGGFSPKDEHMSILPGGLSRS